MANGNQPSPESLAVLQAIAQLFNGSAQALPAPTNQTPLYGSLPASEPSMAPGGGMTLMMQAIGSLLSGGQRPAPAAAPMATEMYTPEEWAAIGRALPTFRGGAYSDSPELRASLSEFSRLTAGNDSSAYQQLLRQRGYSPSSARWHAEFMREFQQFANQAAAAAPPPRVP